jgi:hypothetical protein
VPDEPAIAAHRARLASLGLHPFSLTLAVDVDRWLQQAPTPWDAFPDTHSGKFDAETAPLARALKHDAVSLHTGVQVKRLLPSPDGKRIAALLKRGAARFSSVQGRAVGVAGRGHPSAASWLWVAEDREADRALPASVVIGPCRIEKI